jgi:Domain of unknown function (DUF4439)
MSEGTSGPVTATTTAAPTSPLAAVQEALAAEYAAVYGYGVVGARIGDDRQEEARQAYAAHQARRDTLRRTVQDLGGRPAAAAPAYALPFPVPDAAAAVRLAADLEGRVADVYGDMVRATTGALRREAADALRDAAVRAVRWRGGSVPFPGLAERQPSVSSSPSESADAL